MNNNLAWKKVFQVRNMMCISAQYLPIDEFGLIWMWEVFFSKKRFIISIGFFWENITFIWYYTITPLQQRDQN